MQSANVLKQWNGELPLFYRPPISGHEPSPVSSVDGHSDHGNESSHTTVSVMEFRGERDDDEDIETGPSQRDRRCHYSHDASSKKVMLRANSQTLTSTCIESKEIVYPYWGRI